MPTGLTVVCGGDRRAAAATARALWAPGTVLLAHDLRGLGEGVLRRRVVDVDGGEGTTVLALAHGCVSCTLREDLLPMLRRLARDPEVRHVLLLLDPGLEPEPVLRALATVLLDGWDAPVGDELAVHGVVGVLDAARWLAEATGDESLAERGAALTVDDDRTVAQLAVGHAELSDVIVLAGETEDAWARVRLEAVLARLAPRARRVTAPEAPRRLPDVARRLAHLPEGARRGALEDPHAPLLRGQPPLARDAGVALLHVGHRRPFHPQRLHEAFEVLLAGAVRVRGRAWVATRPDRVLWLDGAGGGLRVGEAGRWLAADESLWDVADDEHRAAAALRWDERYGDREQQLAVLLLDTDPAPVVAALDAALLTDAELAAGEDVWRTYPDPFAGGHVDPCAALEVAEEFLRRDGGPR